MSNPEAPSVEHVRIRSFNMGLKFDSEDEAEQFSEWTEEKVSLSVEEDAYKWDDKWILEVLVTSRAIGEEYAHVSNIMGFDLLDSMERFPNKMKDIVLSQYLCEKYSEETQD